MAERHFIPEPAPFNRLLAAYKSMVALRDLARADADVEQAERLVEPIFHEMVASPAETPMAILSKGEAMLAEHNIGLIPSDLVEALLADVRGLVQ